MLWFVVINFYKTSNAFYKHREYLNATQYLQSSTLRSRIGGRNAHAVLSAISAFARSHSRFRRIELTSTIAIIIVLVGKRADISVSALQFGRRLHLLGLVARLEARRPYKLHCH